jgi:hypothetical protein
VCICGKSGFSGESTPYLDVDISAIPYLLFRVSNLSKIGCGYFVDEHRSFWKKGNPCEKDEIGKFFKIAGIGLST